MDTELGVGKENGMRLIDADAFKNYIRGALDDVKHLYKDNGAWAKEITDSFCMDIDEQPTVEAEPRWTPCSERLPEEQRYCLTSCRNGLVCEDFHWNNGYFDKADKYHHEVIAWMPLPKPYR